MRFILGLALSFLSVSAKANLAVMEGIAASSNTVYVDTVNVRLDVGTNSYAGGIPGVFMFVSSNVVISTGAGAINNVVIYATGSVMANGVRLSSGNAPSALTASAAFVGLGTNASPLGINSSSVPVYSAASNLSVPYGVTAQTMTVSGGGGISPAATFSPNLSSNTTSGSLSGTFTNTALGACTSASTVTLTLPTNSTAIMVGLNGTISVNSQQPILVGILVDGAFVNGENSSKGLTAPVETVVLDGTNVSFSAPVTGLASGTHNICLVLAIGSGTGTIDSTNSVMRLWAYMLP